MPESQITYSLERRLVKHLLLIVLPMLAVMLLLIHLGMNSVMREFVLSRLQHDADDLISSLEKDQNNRWQLIGDGLPGFYDRALSGHYFQVALFDSGDIVARSRSLWDLNVPTLQLTPQGSVAVREYPFSDSQNWLIWQQGFSKQNQIFSLWIAEDIAPLRYRLYRFEALLLLAGLILVTIIYVLQRILIKRGFDSLRLVRDSLEQQQNGNDVPLPALIPLEIKPLVDSIHNLLQQSLTRINRSRTALGNLAHELKRPLQQLNLYVERTVDPVQKKILLDIHQSMLHLVETQLRRARIAGAPSPGRCFSPQEEIPALVSLLENIHDKKCSFSSSIPKVNLPFDRDDMLELVGNLMDNAWRHAHGKVSLVFEEKPNQQWIILIDDDGDGVDESQFNEMLQRGARLDEGVHGAGHGIGLALCEDIAASYGGNIRFGKSALGGLNVQVSLSSGNLSLD